MNGCAVLCAGSRAPGKHRSSLLAGGAGLCSRHLDVQWKRPLAIRECQGLLAPESGCGYWLRRVPLDWMPSERLIRFELVCWIGPNPTSGADSGSKHVDRGRQRPSGLPTALHRGLAPTDRPGSRGAGHRLYPASTGPRKPESSTWPLVGCHPSTPRRAPKNPRITRPYRAAPAATACRRHLVCPSQSARSTHPPRSPRYSLHIEKSRNRPNQAVFSELDH